MLFQTKSLNRTRTHSFTLLELLIVIAIIAILAAFLLPMLSRSREMARASNCMANLKNIGVAITNYLDSYEETFFFGNAPGAQRWSAILEDFEKGEKIFFCPSDALNSDAGFAADSSLISYGYNLTALGFVAPGGKPNPLTNDGTEETEFSASLSVITTPSATAMFCDAGREAADGRGYYLSAPSATMWADGFTAWGRHQKRSNVIFVDGHVESLSTPELNSADQSGANAAPINDYRLWSPLR